ncbi:hypothetical protein YZ17_06985 [Campylobacter lari]|nr:hypothetical protein [Campylobacter lari]EAK9878155.1 hypothetical protein [Campylobacter lari]
MKILMKFFWIFIFLFNTTIYANSATQSINNMNLNINQLDKINTNQNKRNNEIIALNKEQLFELKKHNFLFIQYNNLLLNFYKISNLKQQ